VSQATFKVRFGDVHAGWLSLQLHLGGATVQEPVSHTPNDPLGELAGAALGVLEGTRPHTVTCNVEPAQIRLTFSPTGGDTEVTVERWPDHRGDVTTPEVLGRARAERVEVAKAVWRALRELESRWRTHGYDAQWEWPFPTESVRRLGEELAGVKPAT
jgi:hypothetical protein